MLLSSNQSAFPDVSKFSSMSLGLMSGGGGACGGDGGAAGNGAGALADWGPPQPARTAMPTATTHRPEILRCFTLHMVFFPSLHEPQGA